MRKLCLLFLVTSLLLSPALLAATEPPGLLKSVQVDCQHWIFFLDRKDYLSAYTNTGAILHGIVNLNQWTNTLSSIRGNFGDVNSRTLSSHDYMPTGFDGKAGEFMTLTYSTQFSKLGMGMIYSETVVLHHEASGWFVVGYALAPPPPTVGVALPRIATNSNTLVSYGLYELVMAVVILLVAFRCRAIARPICLSFPGRG